MRSSRARSSCSPPTRCATSCGARVTTSTRTCASASPGCTTSPMPDLDLDARLDDLFATDPKEFTAARDALARDLKAADRADEAADVKALRRPPVAVAAVNRTARERVDQVAALVELGE